MSAQERWQLSGSAPDAYERHIVPALARYVSGGTLVWPIQAHVVTARA